MKILNYLLNRSFILSFIMIFISDAKKEKIYIESIRSELSLHGHNVYEMTDEEIKEGMKRAREVIINSGFTVSELAKAANMMGKLSKKNRH